MSQAQKQQGTKALRKAAQAGRKSRLHPAQLEALRRGLQDRPEALGYGTSRWTTWRVADLIERQTGHKFHPGHVWRILVVVVPLPGFAFLELELPATRGSGRPTR